MQTTTIEWRAVNVSPETKTYGAHCQGSWEGCAEPVAFCRQWQVARTMQAPAFDYYCADHAAEGALRDGLTLPPVRRSATVDGFSTPIQYPDSVQESDSEISDSEISESNPYAVGSIWHTSWGYDQTNVEYYTVVRESKASVWLVPMSATVRDGRLYPGDPLQWSTDASLAPTPSMHRKGKHGAYLRLDYVRHAWPYEGGGCYDTLAAGQPGH